MTKTGKGLDNFFQHRVIAKLEWAVPCARPNNLPIARRLRGTKRLGLTFEKKFAKALQAKWPTRVLSGQWFNFRDENGFGYCQTDVLLVFSDEVLIFECKLTDVDRARSQLSKLYLPVVSKAFAKPAKAIVVTRHLSKETHISTITDQFSTASMLANSTIPTFHWLGHAPL